jgi:predicted regulator of Ras-like GTPase activity (Roadblock/LC7/MglB family)
MTLSLAAARTIQGLIRANLINSRYGMGLMSEHVTDDFPDSDMETAAMTETYSAGARALHELGQDDQQEDMILTLDDYYHVMRAVEGVPEVFMHVVLDRRSADLDAARARMAKIARDVSDEFAA